MCRPTPFGGVHVHERAVAQKSTHALHGTTLAHASIFPSGPEPANPPKRSAVANVQKNYLSLLSEAALSGNADNCLRGEASRLSSPWLCARGLSPRSGNARTSAPLRHGRQSGQRCQLCKSFHLRDGRRLPAAVTDGVVSYSYSELILLLYAYLIPFSLLLFFSQGI